MKWVGRSGVDMILVAGSIDIQHETNCHRSPIVIVLANCLQVDLFGCWKYLRSQFDRPMTGCTLLIPSHRNVPSSVVEEFGLLKIRSRRLLSAKSFDRAERNEP
jgi:hypothetical protein